MIKEWLIALAIGAALCVVGAEDRNSAEVTANIVEHSERPITHYSIKQDSPGLKNEAYEPFPIPFTSPIQR